MPRLDKRHALQIPAKFSLRCGGAFSAAMGDFANFHPKRLNATELIILRPTHIPSRTQLRVEKRVFALYCGRLRAVHFSLFLRGVTSALRAGRDGRGREYGRRLRADCGRPPAYRRSGPLTGREHRWQGQLAKNRPCRRPRQH